MRAAVSGLASNLSTVSQIFSVEKYLIGMNTCIMVKTYHSLDMLHEFTESDKSKFSFHVGILAQMPACVTILCPKALLNTEYISKTWQAGLEIQLRTLRQICRLPIIVELEQCCAAFHRSLHEARWGDFQNIVFAVRSSKST